MKKLLPLDTLSPLPVPDEARTMATSLANDAGTIQRAQGTSTNTASLDQAIAAATRLASGSKAMLTNLKRQRAEAVQAQHQQAADDRDRLEREAAIRVERGLPPAAGADLKMPVLA